MNELVVQSEISSHILTLRGKQVMLDRDLAELYQVKATRLRELDDGRCLSLSKAEL